MNGKFQWSENELLVSLRGRGALAGEQYRRMRIRLEGLNETLGGTLKFIVVTSPLTADGKTATTANLAVGLAVEARKKVLLVDGDMRRPKLYSYFQGTPRAGLGDVLVGGVALADAVTRVEGTNLDVLPLPQTADRRIDPLPIERLRALFSEARPHYDYILCDAPPVLPIADTAALARLADGIVVVVRAGVTPRDAVTRTLDVIDRSRLAGFVLNAVPERELDRYYYSDYVDQAEGGGARETNKEERTRGGSSS